MEWAMIGWSHHETPVELRERLAFSKEQILDALGQLGEQFPGIESVLLSTCNRVELYCAAKSLPSVKDLGQFISDFHGFAYDEIESQATILNGEDSIRHLFTVAASLDSMVIGEAQILSQVKQAYELACEGEFAASRMHLAFQRATNVAKRVATETEIHRRRISVPSVAVSEIATEFFERFDDKKILLIGAGEMGTETLQYLMEHGANRVTIVNRSSEKAQELANSVSCEAKVSDWSDLFEELMHSDLVVSTTGASEPIVGLEAFQKQRSQRTARAVLILDLAVPRDFDHGIGSLPDVYLYTVDDLQQACDRNLQARRKEWPKAEHIVKEETKRFLSETKLRGSGATIKQLREQAEKVKTSELEKLLGKLEAKGIEPSARKDIEIAFDRVVNKLLHPPLQSLRENADSSQHETLIQALRRLFKLKE